MNHAALPLTDSGIWTALSPAPSRRPTGWMNRFSQGLATVVVFGLLIAMVGGAFYRQNGFFGGNDAPGNVAGVAASPEATPADAAALSCGSPGYRAVVEGEVDADELASIGETETPLNIDGAHINVPTANGEVVTLASTWTYLGGPIWWNQAQANSDGKATIRNVDTNEEWYFSASELYFPGRYDAPFVIIPANPDATDFRIINTENGHERLVSDIRGKQFSTTSQIERIDGEMLESSGRMETSAWLFSPIYVRGPERDGDPPNPAEISVDFDGNVLLLPASLEDASFLEDTVDATYFYDTAYSEHTRQFAYATGESDERMIVVIDPDTGARAEIRDDRFTSEALPLMFSSEGSTLVVDQPTAIFSISLADEPIVTQTYVSDDRFVPIVHNPKTANVLLMYEDQHIEILNSSTGEINAMPNMSIPEDRYPPDQPLSRSSFGTAVYDVKDEDGNVHIINLESGGLTAPTTILDQRGDWVNQTFPVVFAHSALPLYAVWSERYAFMDRELMLHVQSMSTNGDAWGIPPPANFELAADHVVQLRVNPDETCLVLKVTEAVNSTVFSAESQAPASEATWIAPIEPDAEWTKLDTRLTGWVEIPGDSEATETLSAQDFATPLATPELQTVSCGSPGYRAVTDSDAGVIVPLADVTTRELEPGSLDDASFSDENSETLTVSPAGTWIAMFNQLWK